MQLRRMTYGHKDNSDFEKKGKNNSCTAGVGRTGGTVIEFR